MLILLNYGKENEKLENFITFILEIINKLLKFFVNLLLSFFYSLYIYFLLFISFLGVAFEIYFSFLALINLPIAAYLIINVLSIAILRNESSKKRFFNLSVLLKCNCLELWPIFLDFKTNLLVSFQKNFLT